MRKLSAVARGRKKPVVRQRKAASPAPVVGAAAPANPFQAVLRAASFAARKHQGQKRADKVTPYFSHVARVALVLSHEFGVTDEAVLTAALLHDTIEDTATDYDEVATMFGPRVADYVVLLTKNGMLPKQEREEDYIARLSKAPEPVMIAKMADLYDNLSDRIHSPKFTTTAATAQRLLGVFGRRLETRAGLAAHGKLSVLLNEVKSLQFADSLDGPGAASD